jgi:hypothetical protein
LIAIIFFFICKPSTSACLNFLNDGTEDLVPKHEYDEMEKKYQSKVGELNETIVELYKKIKTMENVYNQTGNPTLFQNLPDAIIKDDVRISKLAY